MKIEVTRLTSQTQRMEMWTTHNDHCHVIDWISNPQFISWVHLLKLTLVFWAVVGGGLLGIVKSVNWLVFSIFRSGIGDGIQELL